MKNWQLCEKCGRREWRDDTTPCGWCSGEPRVVRIVDAIKRAIERPQPDPEDAALIEESRLHRERIERLTPGLDHAIDVLARIRETLTRGDVSEMTLRLALQELRKEKEGL